MNGDDVIDPVTVNYNEVVTAPTPTKEGHTFVEWQLEGQATAFDFTTPITANITLNAVWNINTYTVTFDADEWK